MIHEVFFNPYVYISDLLKVNVQRRNSIALEEKHFLPAGGLADQKNIFIPSFHQVFLPGKLL